MIKEFFKNKIISRSCGKNADGKTYMFGVFEQDPFSDGKHPLSDEEACAIINSAYDKGNGIAKIASSESAIEDIKKTGKYIILLNHSYADALMFNQNMPPDIAKEESALIALGKRDNHFVNYANRYRGFITQKYQSDDLDDQGTHFTKQEGTAFDIINLSRLARFNNNGKIGDKMDEYAEKNGITADDLANFVFHHELGRQYGIPPYKGCPGDENVPFDKILEIRETTHEEYADAYALIWHLAKTGDTKLGEYIADMRNMNSVQAGLRGSSYLALRYYTTDLLDSVLDKYRKNPEQFRQIAENSDELEMMTNKIVYDHGISVVRYKDLETDINAHNIIKSDMGKRAIETFKKLGIIADDTSKDDIMNAFAELAKTPMKNRVTLQNKITMKKELKERIAEKTEAEVLKGADYKRAFLTAYADMVSETIPSYESDTKSRYAYDMLHKMLSDNKKTEKQIKTPQNLLRHIAAKSDAELPEGDLTENYCRIKADYAERIMQITTEIKSGEITEKTADVFKEAVVLAKTAKKIATTAKEKNLLPTDNKQLAKIMEKDIKNEFPAELVKIASDKKPSLHQIKKLKQITI